MSVIKYTLIGALVALAVVGVVHHQQTKNVSAVASQDATYAQFQAWKVQYNKPYGGAEDVKRYTIFKTNKDIIEAHNASATTYTVGINQFADLTNEEFSAIYLGFKGDVKTENASVEVTANPTTVDHRTNNRVNAVKNQAQCGSCWAFSTVAALEGLDAKQNGKLRSFSEQQLVDCSKKNSGCNGGLMDYAFDYVSKTGIVSEDSYPYKGVDGKCKVTASTKTDFKNKGFKDVPAKNWKALESAVASQVVSIAVQADQTPFQYYTGGVVTSTACGTQLDHGIAIVGYTEDAWIVRNSWGPSWGEKGYIRIAKGDQSNGAGICGINLSASYPTA